jgi:universal stress protein E
MVARIDPERERVLVAIKPTQRDLPPPAIRACEFAERVDGEILLVSVVFDPVVAGGLDGAAALETAAKSRLIEDQRLELERSAQALRDRGIAVTVRVVWDAAAYRGILRAADEWEPTLVVVGAHERRAMLHTALTDTHWRLVHTSRWPLLLVKQSTSNDKRIILAAVDPSRTESHAVAGDVLKAASRFGSAWNCPVRVVHSFPNPEQFALVSAVEVSPGVFYGTENIAALHRRAVEELCTSYGIDPSHADVRPGEPAAVIGQLMMDHDVRLVVLGLSRHSLLQQVILGSITQAVAIESPCDVLLIPQPSQSVRDWE